MYVLKKIILKSFKKKSENDYFYYYLIYAIDKTRVHWYAFYISEKCPVI